MPKKHSDSNERPRCPYVRGRICASIDCILFIAADADDMPDRQTQEVFEMRWPDGFAGFCARSVNERAAALKAITAVNESAQDTTKKKKKKGKKKAVKASGGKKKRAKKVVDSDE